MCVDCVETRKCIACRLHRQRDAFSQGEWEHAEKNSAQGKCKDCTDRAETHMWQCNRCGQTLHKSFYRKWFETHTTQTTQFVRCDSCIAVEEQQRKQEQAKTYAMVMTQDTTKKEELTTPDHLATIETTVTTVQVLFPSCITPKDIDMNMIWRRDGKHRFCNVKCISCPVNKKIGHWFRRQQTEMHSITDWLQTHSYDGKRCLEHKSKPPTATVDFSQARMQQVLLRKQVLSQQQNQNISTTTVSVHNTHHRNDNRLIHRITTPKNKVETLHLRAQLPARRRCKLIQ